MMESHLALHCDKALNHLVTYYLCLIAKKVKKLTSDSDDQYE
ncbi:23773_t:CDS:1, partial [Cetraspora pellucida]